MTFYKQIGGCVRGAEDAYPTDAPGPCSQDLAESKLSIYFSDFVIISLFTLCSLLYLSVFNVFATGLHSLHFC